MIKKILIVLFISTAIMANQLHVICQICDPDRPETIEKVLKFFHDLEVNSPYSLVKTLVNKRKLSPNVMDEEGRLPLNLAIQAHSLKMVTALLESRANPNMIDEEGKLPLNLAIQARNLEMVTALLKSGANPNIKNKEDMPPLHLAIILQKPEISLALLQHGALAQTPHKRTIPLTLAAELDDIDTVAALLTHGATPFCGAKKQSPRMKTFLLNARHNAASRRRGRTRTETEDSD